MKEATREEITHLLARAERLDVRAGMIRKRFEEDPPEEEARNMILRLVRILWQSGVKA